MTVIRESEARATGNMQEPNVPTLKSLCLKHIERNHVSVGGVVDVMRYLENVNWMIEHGASLREKCINFLTVAYESIRKRRGEDEIREVAGNELADCLHQQSKEREECVRKKRIVGKVVQREAVTTSVLAPPMREGCSNTYSAGRKLARSVSGKSTFPYCSLKAGLKWPSEVDPTSREEHLSGNEFMAVFGMSFNEYQNFPRWKRVTLKKEKLLF